MSSSPLAAGQKTRRALRGRRGQLSERVFRSTTLAAALLVLAIVVGLGIDLAWESRDAIARFGAKFLVTRTWDPVHKQFGALPYIYGTIVTSLIAIVLAFFIGLGAALFLTDLCPRRLRTPLASLIELLAAIPSVVYGLWGVFVLAPLLRTDVEPFLHRVFGPIPVLGAIFSGPQIGIGLFAGGVILAIMILPTVTAIARDVLRAVPPEQREAAYALGATRWEVLSRVVLPYARSGVLGAVILGLGRALGETIAVTMVIGGRPQITHSLFSLGYTIAAVIANEFTEATYQLYLSSLFELGLILLAITMLLNICARVLVWRITRSAVGTTAL
jgi:phosphate transport system permease protein